MNIFDTSTNFFHRAFTVVLLLGVAVGLGVMTFLAINQILIILFAAILSVPMVGLIGGLAHKSKLNYTVSYIICWLLLAALVSLVTYLGADSIQTQFQSFTETSAAFSAESIEMPSWVPDSLVTELRTLDIVSLIQQGISGSSVNSTVSSVFNGITGLIILVALVAFFTFSPQTYKQTIYSITPSHMNASLSNGFKKVPRILNRWMLGRLVSMVAVTILTYVGLLLLGIQSPLILALLAGLLSFIPNLGPLLSVVPAVIIAFQTGIDAVLLVVGLYALVQFVESYLITPVVQKKAVEIDPAFLLSTQIIFGAVFGFMGLLLAGPLLAIAIGVRSHN
jgi:predicted PurR-regulated permease PerM